MHSSPTLRLVSRQCCACKPQSRLLRANVNSRSISNTAQRGQHYTPGAAHYGSPDTLRRRNRRTPEEDDRQKREQAQLKQRMKYAAYGIGACAVGLMGTVYLYPGKNSNTTHLDAPSSTISILDATRQEVEQVETGTSTIPTFPKHIHLSEVAAPENTAVADKGEQEYQLVGLGVRTVFYVQVYVVGLYIAVADIAKLQERLVRTIDPVATTLVAGEKGNLKKMLLDNDKGEEIWNDILKDGGIRMVFRIVPTRNTDFVHLRDGWVRGITAKSQHFSSAKNDKSFSDEAFGMSLNEFKTVLGGGFRKKVPWGETVLLTRDGKGVLNSWYEDKEGTKVHLGAVQDERISRLLWLIYLGGAKVSSEPLRQSIIDGVMEFVERPVGTVATQVV